MACHDGLVPDRLSPLDVSFLYFEEPTTPMHVGSVAVFQEPDAGFDHDRLVRLISNRIAFVPRYRQRIRWVPGRLANPVWVDDEDFDISYHVRRSALPRPGSDAQLAELVARVQSRSLDRSRPLWEMYLVEGLSDNRFAIISKTHHAMVDGMGAVDIGQVILDTSPDPRERPQDTWRPVPGAVLGRAGGRRGRRDRAPSRGRRRHLPWRPVRAELRRRPGAGRRRRAARGRHQRGPGCPREPAQRGDRRAPSLRHARAGPRRPPPDPQGARRAPSTTSCSRPWPAPCGPGCSPAARRSASATTVRALVPVSVRTEGENPASGNHVSSYLVDLPVGEPSAVMRLHQVSYRMQAHKDTGQAVGATALAGLAGFAPPTLHSLGARVASGLSKRWFNLVVTNVPGPQQPLYAGDARMLAAYPVVPLAKGQALTIGLTSYDGQVFYGLNADRDAMPDVDVLAQCLDDALAELLETVR